MSIDRLVDSSDGSGSGLGDSELSMWEHILDGLIESYPDPVLVVDDRAVITHWDGAMEEMHGVPREDTIGEQAYDVVGPKEESETLAETVVRTAEAVREDKNRSGTDSDGISGTSGPSAFR